MSEVDLTQVFQRMRQAVDQLSQAWQIAARQISQALPQPAEAEQPDRFEHTDDHGDGFVFGPGAKGNAFKVLWLETQQDHEVHLNQEGVNGLAQYLDRYRTDTADAPVREHWCGSDSDHAEHTHGRQDNPARCLGCYRGHYGVTKDMT